MCSRYNQTLNQLTQMSKKLFSATKLGSLLLKNHLVMAPMTRNRAIGNLPNALMAAYYAQRAEAGLIVTEGTAPSANGLGYARIPGVYSLAQVEGWKLVTKAVHDKGGKIFLQLMHTGRISHSLNMEPGAEIQAPSAVAASGEIYTDQSGMVTQPIPKAMSHDEIKKTVIEYVHAAKNAIEAGFDGVELHGANGYLIEQFLSPNANLRTDEYGGSLENHARFALEVAQAVVDAIGKDKTGIRLSPYGVFNDVHPYSEELAEYLAKKLNDIGLVYLHLVNHESMGAPAVTKSVVDKIRKAFTRTLIVSGGYDADKAEADLQSGLANLVAFGRTYLANPDLAERYKTDAELNAPDFTTFYTPGEKGYTDYPVLHTQTA